MKICFYVPSFDNGGAERVIANLSKTLVKNGHNVSIITIYATSGTDYETDELIQRHVLYNDTSCDLVAPQTLAEKFRNYFPAFLKFFRTLKKDHPDVLISFLAIPNLHSAISAHIQKVKLIVSVRNDPIKEYKNGFLLHMADFLFRHADGCVFQTQEAKQNFSIAVQEKSKIIFNPINDVFFHQVYQPAHNHIVTCGRLVAQKNQKMLIAAFYNAHQLHPSLQLHIYGVGPLEEELKRQILTLHLEKSVFLMGRSSNVPEILSGADLFVLSSDFEGMPNALMEAMAVGVPCISTDCPCGGPRTLLEDGKSGILVPVGDEQAMAQAIITLLENPKLRDMYGRNAKALAANFTQEKICRQWMSYINEIVGEN